MRLLCLIICLVAATSCNKTICKESHQNPSSCPDAIIKWTGPPEADGLGWVLRFADGKTEKPSNLEDEFKTDDLKVSVCYEQTNEKFPCFCARGFIEMVKIVSISKR